MFWMRNKENKFPMPTLIWRPDLCVFLQDLGTPTEKIWPGVMELPGMKKCSFTEYSYNTLRSKFGQYLSDVGFDLLNR